LAVRGLELVVEHEEDASSSKPVLWPVYFQGFKESAIYDYVRF
jgi:hypothetical protein